MVARIRRRRLWLIAWITYWVTLFVIMHIPIPEGVTLPPSIGDKSIHVVAYLILTVLGLMAVSPSNDVHVAPAASRWRRVRLAWAFGFILYGALDEWLQQVVNRHASLADWVADAAGVVAGVLLVGLIEYWGTGLRRRGRKPFGAGPMPSRSAED